MRKPELSFHGQITGNFTMFLATAKLVESLRGDTTRQTRAMCYSAGHLSEAFHKALAEQMGIDREAYEMEIYIPTHEYPAHTDSGGTSYMIPLEHDCTASINGTVHKLLPWAVYSFNDGKPHATTGGMLMMKLNP